MHILGMISCEAVTFELEVGRNRLEQTGTKYLNLQTWALILNLDILPENLTTLTNHKTMKPKNSFRR